jgi:5-methylcytosine-specific restriction endonuclease McrA
MRSEATRLKISLSQKARGSRPPWAVKGQVPKNLERIRKLAWKKTRGSKKSPEVRMRMSLEQRGERSHRWKGGISPLKELIRGSLKYRVWRKAVFDRDDYTCQLCQARGVYLHADHHPKMFAEILIDSLIDTFAKALKCRELWDINNGRTLCSDCHTQYGRRILNLKQHERTTN